MTTITANHAAPSTRRALPVVGPWLAFALVAAVAAVVVSGLLVDARAAAGMAGLGVFTIALVAALRGTNAHGTDHTRR